MKLYVITHVLPFVQETSHGSGAWKVTTNREVNTFWARKDGSLPVAGERFAARFGDRSITEIHTIEIAPHPQDGDTWWPPLNEETA